MSAGGNLIDLGRDLPPQVDHRQKRQLRRVLEASDPVALGLNEDAKAAFANLVADTAIAAARLNTIESEETYYGSILIGRAIPVLTMGLMPFPENARVLPRLRSGSAQLVTRTDATRSVITGAVSDAGDPLAMLRVEYPDVNSFLTNLAEVVYYTVQSNPVVERVAVANGGMSLSPVTAVMVEFAIRQSLVAQPGGDNLILPEQSVIYPVTLDGNTRCAFRRAGLFGSVSSEQGWYEQLQEWLTEERQIEVDTERGQRRRVAVKVLRTTEHISRTAWGMAALIRDDPRAGRDTEDRYDPDDAFKNRIASFVTATNMVVGWKPAPDIGTPNPGQFRSAFDLLLEGIHAQTAWDEDAKADNYWSSVLRRLESAGSLTPLDAGLMRADDEVALDLDDVEATSEPFANALETRFPESGGQGMRLLKVAGMGARLLSSTDPAVRDAILDEVAGWKRLTTARKGEVFARAAGVLLDDIARRRWEGLNFRPIRSAQVALSNGALPLSLLSARWEVTDRHLEDIVGAAKEEAQADHHPDGIPGTSELVALAVPALCYGGWLHAGGGARVDNDLLRRHGPWDMALHTESTVAPVNKEAASVVTALSTSVEGIEQLAEAVQAITNAIETPGRLPIARAVDWRTREFGTDLLNYGRLVCLAFPEEVQEAYQLVQDGPPAPPPDAQANPEQVMLDSVRKLIEATQEVPQALADCIDLVRAHQAQATPAVANRLQTAADEWEAAVRLVFRSIQELEQLATEIKP